MALLAAAALFVVLFPPLRKRLLGLGRRRDKLAAALFGVALSAWGATLGFRVNGEPINVRDIGVLIGAILGGRKAGVIAGLGGGLWYAAQVKSNTAIWVVLASVIDGALAGLVAKRSPQLFWGARAFVTSFLIQSVHLSVVGVGLFVTGSASRYMPALPAHLVKLVVNSAGVTLFMVVARLIVTREESAAALANAEAAASRSSLEALRRKIEPHFLFNALNAIRAVIRKDPPKARELVSDLADMYRYLLNHPEDAPLRDEITHACAYLAIEQARLGEARLSWSVEVAQELACVEVPALLLQPLVENAVQHGVSARSGSGHVDIRVRQIDSRCVLEVRDKTQGPHAPSLSTQGSGVALVTLRKRLHLRFGDSASIELIHQDDGALARVAFPLQAAHTVFRAEAKLLPNEVL